MRIPLHHTLARTLAPGITSALMLFSLLAPLTAFSQEKENESKTKADSITWHKYEDGLKLAGENGKQVLIDFSTSWCGWCKKMDRETFTDSRVIDFINEHFVAVRIDGDSPRKIEMDGFKTTEKKIAKEMYGVRGYPTFWFLESDGAKIGSQPGYQSPDAFMSLLEYVKSRRYEETQAEESSNSGR